MKTDRLFEIVYILLNKNNVTAKQLADRFDVSIRTIYRDIETLSSAGIPVYMTRGKGGGISVLENFILNKSLLTENEQDEILFALQGFNALDLNNSSNTLAKLSDLFKTKVTNWIDVDFSHWGGGETEKQKFNLIKNAIITKNIITFDYYAPYNEKLNRKVEPLQILFKEKSWYLKSYCTQKLDYRIFKIARMQNIELTDQSFERLLPDIKDTTFLDTSLTKVKLLFDNIVLGRVFDEIDQNSIILNNNNTATVEIDCPIDEWIYSYIFSYCGSVEVLEPSWLREEVKNRLEKNLEKYL